MSPIKTTRAVGVSVRSGSRSRPHPRRGRLRIIDCLRQRMLRVRLRRTHRGDASGRALKALCRLNAARRTARCSIGMTVVRIQSRKSAITLPVTLVAAAAAAAVGATAAQPVRSRYRRGPCRVLRSANASRALSLVLDTSAMTPYRLTSTTPVAIRAAISEPSRRGSCTANALRLRWRRIPFGAITCESG